MHVQISGQTQMHRLKYTGRQGRDQHWLATDQTDRYRQTEMHRQTDKQRGLASKVTRYEETVVTKHRILLLPRNVWTRWPPWEFLSGPQSWTSSIRMRTSGQTGTRRRWEHCTATPPSRASCSGASGGTFSRVGKTLHWSLDPIWLWVVVQTSFSHYWSLLSSLGGGCVSAAAGFRCRNDLFSRGNFDDRSRRGVGEVVVMAVVLCFCCCV